MASDDDSTQNKDNGDSDSQTDPIDSERSRGGAGGKKETAQKVLTAILAVALVVALAGVVYIALTPQQATDPYTEFYILGAEGNASDYPTNLTAGEEATVTVGVTNREQQQVTYTMLVTAGDRLLTSRTLTVGNERTWEEPVQYTLNRTGDVRVRFLLYQGSNPTGNAEPYRLARLWTNVTQEN